MDDLTSQVGKQIEIDERVIVVNHINRTAKTGILRGQTKFKWRVETADGMESFRKDAHKIFPYDEDKHKLIWDAAVEIVIAQRKFDRTIS